MAWERNMNVLARRCRDIRKLYICFIDYKEAFDCMDHKILMKFLDKIMVEERDTVNIRPLYWKQHAVRRCVQIESEEIKINRGI